MAMVQSLSTGRGRERRSSRLFIEKPKPAGDIAEWTIFFHRSVRYLKVGFLLHIMGIIGLIAFFWFGRLALDAAGDCRIAPFLIYGYLSLYGFSLPFFAALDARSRYQNYKMAKDLFHRCGFQNRVARLFTLSRCQRDAARVAARDLGHWKKLSDHYRALGYRWYHILPDFAFTRPSVFLTRKYWQKTLFEKQYTSKYFLW